MWMMFAVLVISWTHGCIGLFFWLRIKPFYKAAAPYLLAAAVLIPTLAMLGLYQGGRNVVDNDSVEWRKENLKPSQTGTSAEKAVLNNITNYLLIGYWACSSSSCWQRARAPSMSAAAAWSTCPMATAERSGCRRASACSRPACATTCPTPACAAAVRAARPAASVSSATTTNCPNPRSAKLSCSPGSAPRIRRSASPASCGRTSDLSFFQLFLPHTVSADSHASNPTRIGQERYLVSMFVDMRGSTKLAEKRLPFDTVFIVNRFLGAVSQAVLKAAGCRTSSSATACWRCSGLPRAGRRPAARR